MTHNLNVETQGKCRKVAYLTVDRPITDALGDQIDTMPAGTVFSIFSGGGAQEELTGDDLLIARYNDPTAPQWLGCIEMFYNRFDSRAPVFVDLATVDECHRCVEAVRAAEKALERYIWEQSLLLSKDVLTEPQLRETLARTIFLEEDEEKKSRLETVVTELDGLCSACDSSLDALLAARDLTIQFQEPGPKYIPADLRDETPE